MTTIGTTGGRTLADLLVPRDGLLGRPLLRESLMVLGGSLLMALCARISVPVPWTDVPLTFQTFGVYLIGALYGPRLGALTMLAYLAEGLLGLPVFSFGRDAWSPTPPGSPFAGLPLIAGPTAGYLFGFPLAAAVVGALAARGWDRRFRTAFPAMLAGSATVLSCGLLWRAGATTYLVGAAEPLSLLLSSVLTFLPGDMVKISLAAMALPSGWRLLGGQR